MDDTSRYGTVRLARRGEIGEAIAMEDIRRGDLVVGKAPVHQPERCEEVVEITIQGFHPEPWMIAEMRSRAFARRRHRRDKVMVFVWIVVAALALYVLSDLAGNILQRAATPVAHAQELSVVSTVTAYTSSEDETDSTPFENAAGTRPKQGSVACPGYLPLGSQVEIEGKRYTCDDRMHAKHRDTNRFDVWKETKAQAFEWGKRELAVTIL